LPLKRQTYFHSRSIPVENGKEKGAIILYYNFGMEYFTGAFAPIASCMHTTLIMTFAAFISAFILSVLLAMVAMTKNRVVQILFKAWLSLFRGTPLLCQLFLFCFGIFPLIPGIRDTPLIFQGSVCLALAYSAYMCETIRGAIQSVDKGQMEACLSCGLTKGQGYRRVVLPQAFRLSIPALMNNFIDCFKATALCSTVGVTDMMLRSKMLANKSYHFLEVYLAVIILYWALNMLFVLIQKVIEHKLDAKY